MRSSPPELATKNPTTNKITFTPHSGQWDAWNATERFIAVIAGTQSGKTAFGPHWLLKEIRQNGPGDYLVVTPTYQLLAKKALPEFLRLFQRWNNLGEYNQTTKQFVFSEYGCRKIFGDHDPDKPTVVWFGYATDPESLESATIKAAWLDEAGQKKFKLESWQAILRRLSLSQGRVLITTTPYDLGWLKQQIFDRFARRGKDTEQPGDCDYRVVRFDSTENPQFPMEEFQRAKNDLPAWKFNLFYRGIFTRPAGMIYDCFEDKYDAQKHPHSGPLFGHKCHAFPIPDTWPRFVGMDFGNVNTAAIFLAENPDSRPPGGKLGSGRLYLYAEYKNGNLSAKQHAVQLKEKAGGKITRATGGAKSEDKWRQEFTDAGITVLEPPVSEVEVGINNVYGVLQRGELVVFDTCEGILSEIMSYSRELDPMGEPTEIIDDKATFHRIDALRYVCSYLRHKGEQRTAINPADYFDLRK